jgi:hypothetical protein
MERTPSEISALRDLIDIYMKENFNSPELDPEQLKEEAERLQKHLSKQAAGRVCERSREEWEAAYARIDAYYKDKKEWNKLFRPRVRKSVGKE